MMRMRIAAAAICLSAAALAQPARAQSPKVGLANVAAIFDALDERRDAQSALDTAVKRFDEEQNARNAELRRLKELRDTTLKPGTPQHDQATQDLLKKAIDFDVWRKITMADLQRQQKTMMLTLFAKIETAVGTVAKEKGFDLIIAEQRPGIPDNWGDMDMNVLRQLLVQRTVLYKADKTSLDVSQDVVTRLNQEYHKPAPAPKTP